ncbi:MAG: hypothetical protein EOP49_33820 [Sphingobacteriales bacterium]|nr:MAG: hypothetical protein EOP49_33820 [Sphingobacteriales bacterium]
MKYGYFISAFVLLGCTNAYTYPSMSQYIVEGRKVRVFFPERGLRDTSRPPFNISVGEGWVVSNYTFLPTVIYRTDRDRAFRSWKKAKVYTLAFGQEAAMPLTAIDSFVFDKAQRIIDSLSLKNVLRPAGAKGYQLCSP